LGRTGASRKGWYQSLAGTDAGNAYAARAVVSPHLLNARTAKLHGGATPSVTNCASFFAGEEEFAAAVRIAKLGHV